MSVAAHRFKVTAKYGASRLKPRDQFEREVRENYMTKAKSAGLTVESFKVVNYEVGTGWDFLNHYITVEVIVRGSPVGISTIVALCLAVALGVVILQIWLVGKEIIEALPPGFLTAAAVAVVLFLILLLWRRRRKHE